MVGSTEAGGDGFLAYKAEKEAFVSNLSGTRMLEVNLILLAVPVTTRAPVCRARAALPEC